MDYLASLSSSVGTFLWPFRYQKLEYGHIRLCRLQRSTSTQHKHSDGIIRLELKHHKFTLGRNKAEIPEYTALSYTWGKATLAHTILINGRRFRIRENLHCFLRRLVSSHTPALDQNEGEDGDDGTTWFWIDQICIDQSNISERNSQVRRMHEICNNASAVRVWLGESDASTERAFFVLSALVSAQKRRIMSRPRSEMQDDSPLPDTVEIPEDYRRRGQALFEANPAWSDALSDLFGRPYWTRQWIVQEVWFARVLDLQCGHSMLRQEDCLKPEGPTEIEQQNQQQIVDRNAVFISGLAYAMDCWISHVDGERAAIGARPVVHPQSLFSCPQVMHSVTEPYASLYEALRRWRGQCADPRDRIFALDGLVAPSQRVLVDYSIAVVDVFWIAIAHLFVDGRPDELDEMVLSVIQGLCVDMEIARYGVEIGEVLHYVRAIYEERGWIWRPEAASEIGQELGSRWTEHG